MLLDHRLLPGNTSGVPFCGNCGRELSPAAVACPNCGHPGPAAETITAARSNRTEGFAIASLVCGILGFVGVPLVGSILAIVFGRAARTRISEDPNLGGNDLARAGVIIGWIGLVIGIIAITILIALAFAVSKANF